MLDARMRTFFAVCREKSFTRAADALCVTQPAVSQQIRLLEEELGHRLVSVRGRTVEPTAEGAILLRFAERAAADARRTRELLDDVRSVRSFRIGSTRTVGEYVLPGYLAPWLRAHPDACVSLAVDNSDRLFRALRAGELDFLCVEGSFDRSLYASKPLFRDAFATVCAPRHPLAGKQAALEDLFGETLIIREQGSGSRALIESALAACDRSIGAFARVLEIGNIGAIKSLAASGCGIAILYEASVTRETASGGLARIQLTDFSVSHEYSFVCLPGSLYEADYAAFFGVL